MRLLLLVGLCCCTASKSIESAPMILLGEMHGLEEPPAFAAELALRLSRSRPVMLAVEIPLQEQERVDAFLAGGDRGALLAGEFWRREYQDGRASLARVSMLERLRGSKVRVVCIDDVTAPGTRRDEVMAENLLRSRRDGEAALLLVGNLHIRTVPGAPWDPGVVWAGVHLRKAEPRLLSLDQRYPPGDAWLCFSDKAAECGVKPLKGNATPADPPIQLFDKPDEHGYDGYYRVATTTPSRPAAPP